MIVMNDKIFTSRAWNPCFHPNYEPFSMDKLSIMISSAMKRSTPADPAIPGTPDCKIKERHGHIKSTGQPVVDVDDGHE
jgi:hypothetical protein